MAPPTSDSISRRHVLRQATAVTSGLSLTGVGSVAATSNSDRESSDVGSLTSRNSPDDAPGAVFHVGGSRRSIDPVDDSMATHVGGYGTCDDCPTTDVRDGDQLSAEALVVVDEAGESAVALAVVDLQGWFAGYKDWPYGIYDLRQDVAATLSAAPEEGGIGVQMGPEHVIVQTTHSHAGPDVVGVWGDVNEHYLEHVYTQTRDAFLAAAGDTTPSVLEVGVGDASAPVSATRDEGNSYEGWPKDDHLPILRARDARTGNDRPGTGKTVATYLPVPFHENIINGSEVGELSSGYFGAASRWLEAEIGGTAITGPGTLGDQVSPMQGDGARLADGMPRSYRVVERLGPLMANTALVSLRAEGRFVQDGIVTASDQHLAVPATNPALYAANCGPEPIGNAAGITIERSCQPPYAYGTIVGTWATAFRVGDLAIASEPGEAFPQVSAAIRDSFADAATVFTAGQAQDQLGYYYPPWVAPFTQVYSVNHLLFNVSQTLADENVAGHEANSASLGFGSNPQVLAPTGVDLCRSTEAGVQVVTFPNAADESVSETDDGISVPVGVFPEDARLGGELPANPAGVGEEDAGTPVVDFGDGSEPVAWNVSQHGTYRDHTFPEAGTYEVTARLPEADAEWTHEVTVEDPRHVSGPADYPTTTCKSLEEETDG